MGLLPDELLALVARCLSRDPVSAERFARTHRRARALLLDRGTVPDYGPRGLVVDLDATSAELGPHPLEGARRADLLGFAERSLGRRAPLERIVLPPLAEGADAGAARDALARIARGRPRLARLELAGWDAAAAPAALRPGAAPFVAVVGRAAGGGWGGHGNGAV